jgi:hypothetical protein
MLKIEYNLIYFKRYARWYHWLTIPWCVGALSAGYLAREIAKGNFAVIPALFRGFLNALSRVFAAADASAVSPVPGPSRPPGKG